jgi:predicted outer membrane repeat protein
MQNNLGGRARRLTVYLETYNSTGGRGLRVRWLDRVVSLLVVGAVCTTACYDFTASDWPDSGDTTSGDTDTDTETETDTYPCEPGWTGAGCDICVRYVDAASADDDPDGLRWHRAFNRVADGVDAAFAALEGEAARCQVWVVEGTYFTYESDLTDTIQLYPGVDLYGGFVGDETELFQRDWEIHKTVLDGHDSVDGSFQVFHVLTGADDSRVDGFTVTGGNANQGTNPMSPDNWGGGMLNVDASPTVANCTFVENEGYFGGAIENMHADDEAVTEPQISNCVFENNSAGAFGGAIDNDHSAPSIVNCVFTGNNAEMGAGAINNLYANPTIGNCEFEGNHTDEQETHFGGAIFNSAEAPSISNCSFIGNQAYDGGAIYNDFGAAPVISSCEFLSNTAAYAGGAIAALTGDPVISSCRFDQNIADQFGGGIAFLDDSQALVSDSVFTANHAPEGGALVVNESSVTVSDSHFSMGTANFGGAISSYTSSLLTVDRATFSSNTSAVSGGALDCRYDSPELRDCVFAGNRAPVGGAAWFQGTVDAVVTSSVFAANRATDAVAGHGGGVAVSENGDAALTNCSFTANQAAGAGGAIRCEASSQVELVNSIAWNDVPGEISDETLGVTTVSYSDVQGGVAGDGNLDSDPLFADDLTTSSTWTGVSYDPGTLRTVLVDETASFEASALVGSTVRFDLADPVEHAVAENSTNTVYVFGDLTADVSVGSGYALRDLRLIETSPCIDAANGDAAPAYDIQGTPRVDLFAVADTGVGTPDFADIGAHEHYPANMFGPDEFGYSGFFDDDVSICPDLTSDGTLIDGLADDASFEVAIGAPFSFYGVEYSVIFIDSNGAFSFGEEISASFANNSLPVSDFQMGAVYWDNLDPEASGGVYYDFDGTLFAMQWNVPHADSAEPYDVRAVIDTATGEIHYCFVVTDIEPNPMGSDATSGIQGDDPAVGLQYSYLEPLLTEGLHLWFVPPAD